MKPISPSPLGLCLALALLASALPAQTSLRAFSDLLREMTARVDTAVVQVVTREYAPSSQQGSPLLRSRRGNGSGVVVDPDGLIVTNAHVVGQARRVEVLLPPTGTGATKQPGKLAVAEVIGLDNESDIAVLRVPQKGLPFLPFGDSDAVEQGQLAFAFGSPFGLENSVSMGVVSSVARQIRPDDPMSYIQTDAAVNPGNSGGPLVDASGAVIGINTFILSPSGGNDGIGFAVPGNVAKSVYEQIVKHGRVRRGQIGVLAQSITPTLAKALNLDREWGVIVTDVKPGSAAGAAGIQIKDILLSLNGKPLENARQFGLHVYRSAGETLTLKLMRAGLEMTLQVAVLEKPRDAGQILSLATGPRNIVPKLGVVALDLDERVTPLLPPLRRLSGVVVAGNLTMPAHGDGFLGGDVIYEVNDRKVGSLDDLAGALAGLRHGDAAAVFVERSGQLQYLEVEIE